MTLREAAQRIAAEFDYPAADVNRGVREFLKEMGRPGTGAQDAAANQGDTDEGLVKVNATMSQIPTYVTAVPNGKEKVIMPLLQTAIN